MENSGLLVTFLAVDVAVLVFAGVVLVSGFPKRIRHAIKKNSQRLDGTISKRRSDIEQTQFFGFISSTLTVVFILLLIVNAATWFIHKKVVPLPLAFEAIGYFQWDQDRWKADLYDSSKGNVALQMESWKKKQDPDAKVDLVGLVAIWPTFVIGGLLISIFTLVSLGRAYVMALKHYEADVINRYREYFAFDMQSRHEMVENASSSFS